jgi:transcriptional regulator with XRE-family HTH domain
MSKGTKPRPGNLSRAFSGEVRAWRARKKWSVAELSERSGIKAGRLGYLLRDEVSWNLVEIESVAGAFDLAPAHMLQLAQAELTAHPDRYGDPDQGPSDRVPAANATPRRAGKRAVSPSRDDFDLVAKNPGREPDGDDAPFM